MSWRRETWPAVGRNGLDTATELRSLYLDLVADPVARPLCLGDGDIPGRLAHEGAGTLGELGARRDDVVRTQLDLLRDAGCARTDLDVAALHPLRRRHRVLRRRAPARGAAPGRDRARRPHGDLWAGRRAEVDRPSWRRWGIALASMNPQTILGALRDMVVHVYPRAARRDPAAVRAGQGAGASRPGPRRRRAGLGAMSGSRLPVRLR